MMNPDIRREATDLNAAVFQDAEIWLPALMMSVMQRGQPLIQDRTFNNCLIYGPAVFMAVQGVDLDSCNLGYAGGDIRNLVLLPASPTSVIGAVPVQDCRFFECDFDKIGFTGAEAFTQSILGVRGVGLS